MILNKFEDIDDNELVNMATRGIAAAFEEIIKRYKERLLKSAYMILKNTEDSFDIVQETFIKSHKKLNQFRGDASLYTWLYSIMRHCALDFIRAKDTLIVNNLEENYLTNVIEDKDCSAEKTALHNELHDVIMQAIEQLPQKQKEVIILREIDDLSYKEIADILGCSEGTIMSRLYYAREALRITLEPYMGKKA